MRVDVMRRVDRWCGVPLCFLLTLWRRLAGERRTAPASPRQILCIQTAEMGSLVLALPAVRHLERAHPGAVVHMLVFSTIADAVPAIGLAPAERVLTIDPSSLFTLGRDTWRFMREARRRRIDTVVCFEMFARFGAILAFLSGAAWRAGFHAFGHPGLYCGDLLTHRVLYNPHVHTSEALLAIARSLEEGTGDVPMGKFQRDDRTGVDRRQTDPAARDRMRARLAAAAPAIAGKRLIVVNPNASQLIPIRRWPIESYAALVAKLLEDPGNACVLTGTAGEQVDTRYIADRVKSDRIVDLAGKTSIGDLMNLYNASDLLVTNDSGPAQIAALSSVRILVFFGPETPALYRPLAESERCRVLYSHYACSPCVTAFNQRRTACTDNQCLKVIDVETVHRAAKEMLTGTSGEGNGLTLADVHSVQTDVPSPRTK